MKRSPIRRHPPKPRADANPEYLEWLRSWPCYVCFSRWCKANHLPIAGVLPAARAVTVNWSLKQCGPTEAAHSGVRGLGQKCPDAEAIPLGRKHHQEGPEAQHRVGLGWFDLVDLNRNEVFETLHALYRRETGKDV